jgi:hypothetical protein
MGRSRLHPRFLIKRMQGLNLGLLTETKIQ